MVGRKILDLGTWSSGCWKTLIRLGHVFVDLLPVAGSDFLEVIWVYFYGVFFLVWWLVGVFLGGGQKREIS